MPEWFSSSLYRCPGTCGRVVRSQHGRALLCMCDALPLGRDDGHPFDPSFGAGRIGPPRPYYAELEHTMIAFDDDGRILPPGNDTREMVFIA